MDCSPIASVSTSSGVCSHETNCNVIRSSYPCGFKLIRKLRSALFGAVTLEREVSSGDLVAVKESCMKNVAAGRDLHGHFVQENPRREQEILHKLSSCKEPGSQHVIKYLSGSDDGSTLYTILEYCEKGEFFDYVQRQQCGVELAQRFLRPLAEGVHFLHKNRIAHRDISLENILLTSQNEVRICDFGLALVLPESSNMIQVSSFRPGKPSYMAPEVLEGVHAYDGFSCDVYSLGIILWILLTGSPPYKEARPSDRRFRVLMEGIDGMHRLLTMWDKEKYVSDEAMDLVSHMVCPANKRYTIEEVLDHKFLCRSRSEPVEADTAMSETQPAPTETAVAAPPSPPSMSPSLAPSTPSTSTSAKAVSAPASPVLAAIPVPESSPIQTTSSLWSSTFSPIRTSFSDLIQQSPRTSFSDLIQQSRKSFSDSVQQPSPVVFRTSGSSFYSPVSLRNEPTPAATVTISAVQPTYPTCTPVS